MGMIRYKTLMGGCNMNKLLLIMILLFSSIPINVSAEPHGVMKAAFIRDDDLWIKNDSKEVKLTNGEYIRFPKWSYDGTWIAYLKGEKQEESSLYNGDLILYNLKTKKRFIVQTNVKNNFHWSPNSNTILFQVNNALFRYETNLHSHGSLIPISSNIANFSWLPNGNGILTSAKEGQELDSDIILSKITFKGKNKMPIITPFYTIQVEPDEFYVSTSSFKWSHDMAWISFLLIPTASLSADSNLLCILSSDGKVLRRIDEMLKYEDWFQWAPSNNSLGYISGVGREVTANKQLKTFQTSTLKKRVLTPKGFVDRDLTWKNNRTIFVSRSKESEWVASEERPLPSLYKVIIETNTNKKSRITYPTKNKGDFQPEVYLNNIVWIRSDRKSAQVLFSPLPNTKEHLWIKNINVASFYYEKWNWDEVFSLYKLNN